MASIEIELYVDENGNFKVVADGTEAFDNLDGDVAVRKYVLNVEVPEPKPAVVEVIAPADPVGEFKITPQA